LRFRQSAVEKQLSYLEFAVDLAGDDSEGAIQLFQPVRSTKKPFLLEHRFLANRLLRYTHQQQKN